MPQKDDVVYVQIYHKLFEVRTAQVVYTLAGMPTYYRCIMDKYNPTASCRETEEFRESIEDLTVSQEDLFGDVISQEVADNNETVETAYNTTTYVDPTKEYDIMSIVVQQVHGAHNNLISNAYYRFKEAEKNIVHVDLVDGRTISHEVTGVCGAAKVLIRPAKAGRGIIAGGASRIVLELAGVKDVVSKSLGSNTQINTAKATIEALASQRTIDHVASLRGKTVEEVLN
jgi:hypothetical protein